MPAYREGFLERMGHDGLTLLRAAVWSIPIALLAAAMAVFAALEGDRGWLVAIAAGAGAALGAAVLIVGGTLLFTHGVADAALSVLWPSGASSAAPPSFSLQEAMVARGDVRGALASYEQLIRDPATEWRVAIAARLQAAELCVAGEPHRARALLEAARAHPRATAAQDLTATNRLVDLYLGALDDPAAARAELSHIVERHPNSTAAAHARTLLLRTR